MEQCSHVIQRHWWYYVTSRKRETNALRFVRRHGSQVHPGKKRFGHKRERKVIWVTFRPLQIQVPSQRRLQRAIIYMLGASNVQCVLCSVYFSAQLNKLRPILRFEFWHPVEHIFVPACSSVRKIHFQTFL